MSVSDVVVVDVVVMNPCLYGEAGAPKRWGIPPDSIQSPKIQYSHQNNVSDAKLLTLLMHTFTQNHFIIVIWSMLFCAKIRKFVWTYLGRTTCS